MLCVAVVRPFSSPSSVPLHELATMRISISCWWALGLLSFVGYYGRCCQSTFICFLVCWCLHFPRVRMGQREIPGHGYAAHPCAWYLLCEVTAHCPRLSVALYPRQQWLVAASAISVMLVSV